MDSNTATVCCLKKCCVGDLSKYPSVKWKLQNIQKLKNSNPEKFREVAKEYKTNKTEELIATINLKDSPLRKLRTVRTGNRYK